MKMTVDELREVLEKHAAYLSGDGDGRADLRGADFSGANLRVANLSGADLRGADFSGANLRYTDLSGANLSYTDFSGADLRVADLSGADLRGADFSGANLRVADLSGADFSGANLSVADLSGAIDGQVCRMDFGGWSICIRSTHTTIGCQNHPNGLWLNATDNFIAEMHEHALTWWKIHGEAVCAAIRCVQSMSNSTK